MSTEKQTERALAAIEAEIGNIARMPVPTRPAVPVKAEPKSVEDVGRLAADAVLGVYEATAQRVEEMGTEVKDRIKQLSDALAEADSDLKTLQQAAQTIRDKGAIVRTMIQVAADRSKSIRSMCDDFQKKLEDAISMGTR